MPSTPTSPPENGDSDGTKRRRSHAASPFSSRLLLVAAGVIMLILLVAAVILVYRFLASEMFSASTTTENSVESGASPNVTLTNENGSIVVISEEGLNVVEYEMTGYGSARDEAAANERASEVEAVVQREEAEGDTPVEVGIETSGGDGADYELRVPTGANVRISSGAGTVDVSGLSGDVFVEAGAGDVSVADVRGSVEIASSAGDVEVRDVTGETGNIVVDADSGDVSLSDLVVATVAVEVAAGTVTFDGRFAGGGGVSVQTGDIVLEAPEEDTRNVTFETRVGEVIRAGEEEE